MEVCGYPCPEQDAPTYLSQLAPHSEEAISQMPTLPLTPVVGRSDQIVILDSSRIAMQIASGQIVWPIPPKPKDINAKLENDVQQSLPFGANDAHPELEGIALVGGQTDTPVEKCKVVRKRPRTASEDAEVHNGDASTEKQAVMRWKDVWVAQLIHIRGRMNAAFAGPQKQRVDLWQVIKNEMSRTCYGFDKDSEACRKKWLRIYKEYKDDKNAQLSGNASQKCKFYDLMEFYMGEKVNGVCDPSTAIGFGVPLTVIPVKNEVTNESGEANGVVLHGSSGSQGMEGSHPIQSHDSTSEPSGTFPGSDLAEVPGTMRETRVTKKPNRRVKQQTQKEPISEDSSSTSLKSMLSELLSIGKEMLQTTKQFEQEKLDVLHSLRETLQEISKTI